MQAVAGETREMDLEQFVVAASRFPNVLFPSYEDRDANGAALKIVLPSIEAQTFSRELKIITDRKEKKENKRIKGESATISFVIPGVEEGTLPK
jgi:hypothetical protein